MNIPQIRTDSGTRAHTGSPGLDAWPAEAAAIYRTWGWEVTVRRDQVWLELGAKAVALMIPAAQATRVITILTARRCPPAVLAHPYAPGQLVLLAGEPYPAALPWPPEVQRVTTGVLLPPTATPRGRLTWAHLPEPVALRLCREIDVLAALRTAPAQDSPSTPTTF